MDVTQDPAPGGTAGDPGPTPDRGQWKSRLGFVLAASGSAIGLGNIVVFGANAYKFGGGAFYLPYLVALILVGIPVMILEFTIGHQSRKAFPQTLGMMAGKAGEFVGWWALLNALIITMYYVTLLGWVLGMLFASFGPLWTDSLPTPAYAPERLDNPVASFFNLLASPTAIVFVAAVWIANIVICARGTKSIEAAVKVFVPAMWVMMIVLIVRGLTLDGGLDGVYYLFNPDFSAMKEPEVWRGAFKQIFFSLTLGFGILTAYASYLPRKADTVNFAAQTSLMNCSFEYIAGFAIFSMLFAFAAVPKASTLSMTFFILPEGIAQLPGGVMAFGILFFLLLLMAGLSSSVSLIEGVVSATIDKFHVRRGLVLVLVIVVGFAGSVAFALPTVIDKELNANGTLGLTLLDLFDNKASGYGLLIVGLLETIVIGWVYGTRRLIENINRTSRVQLGLGFAILVRFVIPAILGTLLVLAGLEEFGEKGTGLYGREYVDAETIKENGWEWIAVAVPSIWIAFTTLGAIALTALPEKEKAA
jgi:NSS family neurotransmitter:Na+ symporter